MRILGASVVVLALVALTSTSAADERTEAKEHFVKGTKAFDLGAYEEAVSEYSAAYRLHDDPALLYNIAQAHRLAEHTTEALRFYRMFLVRSPNATNRDEVEQKITELQKLVDLQKRTQNSPPDHTRSPAESAAPSVESKPTTPVPSQSTQPATVSMRAERMEGRPGRTKKIAGLITAGVGVAALVVGGTFGGLAAKAGDDLTKLDQNMQTFDPAKQSAGKTDQLLEAMFLGIGGAAVIAGLVVYVLGHREARAGSRVAAVPLLGSHTVGAAARMGF
jgi:tetratricopeptide (TPR) repeat protein